MNIPHRLAWHISYGPDGQTTISIDDADPYSPRRGSAVLIDSSQPQPRASIIAEIVRRYNESYEATDAN